MDYLYSPSQDLALAIVLETSVPVVSLNPPKSRSAHAVAVLTVGFLLLQSRPLVEFAYQRMNSFTISWLGGKQPGTVLYS